MLSVSREKLIRTEQGGECRRCSQKGWWWGGKDTCCHCEDFGLLFWDGKPLESATGWCPGKQTPQGRLVSRKFFRECSWDELLRKEGRKEGGRGWASWAVKQSQLMHQSTPNGTLKLRMLFKLSQAGKWGGQAIIAPHSLNIAWKWRFQWVYQRTGEEELERVIEDNFSRITAVRRAKKWGSSWKGMYKSRKSSSCFRLCYVTACLCTEGTNAAYICFGRIYIKLIAMIAPEEENLKAR